MKRALTIAYLIVIAVCLSGFTFASGQKQASASKPAVAAAKELTVALVVNTSDYHTIMPLAQKWSQETGIKLNLLNENTTNYVADYILANRTGSPKIDAVYIWNVYLDELYPVLIPLDGSYSPTIALSPADKKDFFDVGRTFINGHRYLLPYSLDTRMFYYRTDLLKKAGFQQPPKTWQDLVTVAKALTNPGANQWGFASDLAVSTVYNVYTFTEFLFQAGGRLFTNQETPAFNSPAGVEALTFLVDLKNKYKVMPPDVTTYDNSKINQAFVAGRVAMVNHWPYLWGYIADTRIGGKVGYAMEPHPAGGKFETTFNIWGFGIPKISQHKATAWQFMKYVTSTQSGLFEYSKQQDWPLRSSVYSSPEFKTVAPERHQLFSKFVFDVAGQHSESVVFPKGDVTGDILAQYIDKAMSGDMTPKAALDAAATQIKSVLQQ